MNEPKLRSEEEILKELAVIDRVINELEDHLSSIKLEDFTEEIAFGIAKLLVLNSLEKYRAKKEVLRWVLSIKAESV